MYADQDIVTTVSEQNELIAHVRELERERCARAICYWCQKAVDGEVDAATQRNPVWKWGEWCHRANDPKGHQFSFHCSAAAIWNLEDE